MLLLLEIDCDDQLNNVECIVDYDSDCYEDLRTIDNSYYFWKFSK